MREGELIMNEITLASATADVMLYEDSAKQWVRPGENGALTTINNSGAPDMHKLSNVQLLQCQNKTLFRIVAKRIFDGKTLIEQTIFQKLKYQAATKCFHQWRNEKRQVFGLSFSSEQDAERFLSMVQQALDYVASLNEHYAASGNVNNNNNNNVVNTNGNGCYQEALYYQQQSQSHYNDLDQESISSMGNGASNGYRKSSYSANVMNGVNAMPAAGPAGVMQAQQQQQAQFSQYHQQQQHAANIQRRASQGSNNSSSTNSSTGLPNVAGGNGIYATANAPNVGHPAFMGGINRLNISGPPGNPQVSLPPAAQSSSSTETPLSSCSAGSPAAPAPQPAPTIPPISSNAPPPPPPPPPSWKASNAPKALNFADQLKATKLRNTSSNAASDANKASSDGTGTASKNTTSSGQSELLSELHAKIMRRNNAEAKLNNGASEPADKIRNGNETAPACRPWQRATNVVTAASTNGNSGSNTNGVVDSPRVQRKVTSNASLCSQDEAKSNGATNGSSAPVTLADLERFKQELILELNKTKQEILDAVRQELAQFQAK